LGTVLGDDASVDRVAVGRGVVGMKDAVMSFGKAKVGDKTMIDAIVPFADRLSERLAAGDDLVAAWTDAADAATAAAEATAHLAARLGRARAHGDKSLGTPDPGAVSFALITHTVLDILEGKN
jgi:dihydroxyacetone kinase